MQIRPLSQPISVSLNSQRASASSVSTSSPAAPEDRVTLSSALSQSLKTWQTNLAQLKQASQATPSARALRASQRDVLAQRAEVLKQRVKALRQMMSMASPQTVKGMAQVLAQLARELKSLASQLKSLNGGDNDNAVNFKVSANVTDSGGDDQGGDAAASTVTSGDTTTSVNDSSADVGAALGNNATNGSQGNGDNSGLAGTLGDLAAQIKTMRQLLKSLAQHDSEAKKNLKSVDKDLTDIEKTLAAIAENSSSSDGGSESPPDAEAAPAPDTGGNIDVTA